MLHKSRIVRYRGGTSQLQEAICEATNKRRIQFETVIDDTADHLPELSFHLEFGDAVTQSKSHISQL